MVISLDIPFKGSRTYLQSADIFNALVRATQAEGPFRLDFKKLLTTPIEAIPASESSNPAAAPARFRASGPNGQIDLVIRPVGRGEVTARVPYDEDEVISNSVITGLEIDCNHVGSASPIERMVALNKRLILEVLKPGKKLLFTSIALTHLPLGPNIHIKLRFHQGTKIFKSHISSAGERIGEIVFYGV